MTTVLQTRPRQFVTTPAIEQLSHRALRYLQTGYSIHLKGPAGTGKTTLAMHLADLLRRPTMMLFGDDDFKTSDLIGNQTGYTRKKVVDNYIHSVVKVEDELRQSWVDSRLTMACREGFTLVYDEFNRSRPEVNNVLLSALEEKLLVLPPNGHRQEYVRVSPHFRVIFTSNPEEYCGVHATQDALMDRLITIHLPGPDELTQQQILVQKVGIETSAALTIVRVAQGFLKQISVDATSSLRPCLMIANICKDHEIATSVDDPDFRDLCRDILLSRAGQSIEDANEILWTLFNQFDEAIPSVPLQQAEVEPKASESAQVVQPEAPVEEQLTVAETTLQSNELLGEPLDEPLTVGTKVIQADTTVPVSTTKPRTTKIQSDAPAEPVDTLDTSEIDTSENSSLQTPASKIHTFLQSVPHARLSEIEHKTGLNRVAVVNGLRTLTQQQRVEKKEVAGKPAMYKTK